MSLSSFRPRPGPPLPALRIAAAPVARPVDLGIGPSVSAEVLDPADAVRHRDEWLDLQRRGLEPNPFLDPDFLLAAAQHLGGGSRPFLLLVWEGAAPDRHLIGIHALARARPGHRQLARPWAHDLVTIGVPLVDRDRSVEAVRAMLAWASAVGAAGLLLTNLPSDGPVAAAFARVARDRGQPSEVVAVWQRAVLWQGPTGATAGRPGLSAKGAKEARRQRRRLAECGTLGFASARSVVDLYEAVERFLALEAQGWKGAAGTALLMQPGRTAFTRTMMRLLAPRGGCRIDSLTLDGVPVAMGIVLVHGDTDYLWKIAHDEAFARFSPGVQFVLDLTERQRLERRAAVTDSCAIPNHPMIDRLWRDRLDLADVALGSGPGFEAAVARLRLRRRARSLAKRAWTVSTAGWRRLFG